MMFRACVFLGLVAIATAFVCTKDICKRVHCETAITAEECDGRFDAKGGICGCCPICVKQLAHGEQCLRFPPILGSPIKYECSKGLLCHPKNLVCVLPEEI